MASLRRLFNIWGLMLVGSVVLSGDIACAQGSATVLFSEELFKEALNGSGSSGNGFLNSQATQFKDEFTNLLGDFETKAEDNGTGAQRREWKYKKPNDIEGRAAFEGVEFAYTQKAWEGLQTILQEYCRFKQGDTNYAEDIFKKKRPAKVLEDKDEQRQNASFKLMVVGKDEKALDCNSEFPTDKSKMPGHSSGIATTASFDDCSANASECLRSKVVYNAVKIVARSRALHRYKYILDIALRFAAKNPEYERLVTQLFLNSLSTVDIDDELVLNRTLWVQYSDFIGRLAQGQISSNIFRPGAANQSQVGSADKVK
jgi:hypothetical protein